MSSNEQVYLRHELVPVHPEPVHHRPELVRLHTESVRVCFEQVAR